MLEGVAVHDLSFDVDEPLVLCVCRQVLSHGWGDIRRYHLRSEARCREAEGADARRYVEN